MIEPAYRYRATLNRVVDGDTFVLDVDLGFRVFAAVTVRVRDYDAPEARTHHGYIATLKARELLLSKPIVIETYKDQQSFARWIADVWVNGLKFSDQMIEAGFVK